MYRYVIKRLLMLIPVIIGISFLVYFVIDLAPGDIISQIAPEDATIEEIQELREEYGFNKPILVRYGEYMAGMLHGDLGTSYITGEPVFQSYMKRLPNTLMLAFASIFVSVMISIPLGILSAVHQGTWRDNITMVVALLGLSMPNFWLGLLLIILFSLNLGLLPSGGYGTVMAVFDGKGGILP